MIKSSFQFFRQRTSHHVTAQRFQHQPDTHTSWVLAPWEFPPQLRHTTSQATSPPGVSSEGQLFQPLVRYFQLLPPVFPVGNEVAASYLLPLWYFGVLPLPFPSSVFIGTFFTWIYLHWNTLCGFSSWLNHRWHVSFVPDARHCVWQSLEIKVQLGLLLGSHLNLISIRADSKLNCSPCRSQSTSGPHLCLQYSFLCPQLKSHLGAQPLLFDDSWTPILSPDLLAPATCSDV